MTAHRVLPYRDASLTIDKRVEDILSRMTLEEKIAQLSSVWFSELADESHTEEPVLQAEKSRSRIPFGIGQITALASRSPYLPREVARAANQIQRFLVEETRLGIPAILHDECCSGLMARGAAVFPQMIGLASTWEPELVEEITRVIRSQMRAVGLHQGLAPILDVTRDPRWGRVEETFGEDPYLAASMGTAYVRGLQGVDLRQGVAATGKHFAAHGMPEGGLNWAPVHVGGRELREVFLFPFEAAVREAGLAGIMNAYHELDGIPCGANRDLLTSILRDEWGFDGVVVSDYNAVVMLVDYHKVARDKAHAACMALKAGLDVELPGRDCYGDPLLKAVEAGELDLSVVDAAVRHVLRLKFRLGLFDQPYVEPDTADSVYRRSADRELARRAAARSMVLLKNDGLILPLRPEIKTIAVIGPNAFEVRHMVGDYSYGAFTGLLEGGDQPPNRSRFPERFPPTMLTIAEAIRQRAPAHTQVVTARGGAYAQAAQADIAEAVAAAERSDAVLLVLGGKSGLTQDCTSGELRDSAGLGLAKSQEMLLEAIVQTGKPVVLVLVNGRPLVLPESAGQAAAIVLAWLPGEEGGPALAEVLFGDVNPGGRLPITIPRSAGQIPIYYGHKPSGGQSYNFVDYTDLSVRPRYSFGFGLSYTRFDYSNMRIEPGEIHAGDEVRVCFDLTNSGELPGDEVAQLYMHGSSGCVTRPVMELKAFRRQFLRPGETCRITFTVSSAQMAFYNREMQLTLEPGEFEVMVGSSAEDIRLRGSYTLSGQPTSIQRKVFFHRTAVEIVAPPGV